MSETKLPSTSSLRQFRINKSTTGAATQQIKTERVPGKKRVQMLADSDTDDAEAGNSPKKVKVELTVNEKEERFLAAAKICPDYDTMDIQDGLVRNSWDVSLALKYIKENCTPKKSTKTTTTTTTTTVNEKEERFLAAAKICPDYDTMDIQDGLVRNSWDVSLALKYIKENCTPKKSTKTTTTTTTTTTANTTSSSSTTTTIPSVAVSTPIANGSSKTKSKKTSNYDSDMDESGDETFSKSNVYDSEDSDTEVTKEVTGQRKKVFEFINTASLMELQTVKTLSDKKASIILEIRPFKDWSDLCKKLESNKGLSAELLNYTQELINKQNNVAGILTKCNKLVQRLEAAIEAGAGIVEQPKLLNDKLKLADYQMIGLNWLTVMNKQQMNGILADEMGLGKTIQIIAFLAHLKENKLSKGAHLVVVPSSTLDNWAGELARWCPSLNVEKYHGTQEERRRMRIRFAKEGFTGFDVLLTTYHIVGSTPEERKMFRVCKLHYVIFDEAHMLKNMTTQRYANLITINAEMRILLTGTPLQNNLLELMSLLCFVMPSFFGKNVEDIKSLFAKKSKIENENEEVSQFQETQVQRAKRIMKPFVLRRLKKDVLSNLPKKVSLIEKVPMSDSQKGYYNDLVEYYSNNRSELCTGDRGGMSIMTEMRKLANHPLLGRYFFTDDKIMQFSKRLAGVSSYNKTNPQYIFEEMAVMSDFQVWQLCNKHELYDIKIPDKLICDSGKFQYLDSLLPKLKEDGRRVLIFSQFTMILDIVEQYLDIRKHGYFRLDGSTAVEERQDMINDFNTDSEIFIFLLSTKAGGVGINLTAADTCIIHDIDFNPYNDKQAEDRCHRMGQTRPVTIYRLISENTIEEDMLMVATEKLKLEEDITATDKGREAQEAKCVMGYLNKSLNSSLTSPSK